MIRTTTLAICSAAFLAMPALAQDPGASNTAVDITAIDTNGDGFVDLLELTTTYPDLTEADFVAWDVNADGYLDDEELGAAYEAGYITNPENELPQSGG